MVFETAILAASPSKDQSNCLTPEETGAITAFCGRYKDRLHGYRYLAWLMVDRNVACVRPSTLYKIMKRNDLFPEWAAPAEEKKKGFEQPTRPNEQWHTDFSYVRVCGAFYFFACVLDGFSRKILVWDLFPTMEGLNVEILVTRAKELYPESHARIIHDNGKQFTSREFLELVARLELKETSTSPFHPQSNGKIERMHRTFKAEEVRRDDYHGFIDAKKKMGGWAPLLRSKCPLSTYENIIAKRKICNENFICEANVSSNCRQELAHVRDEAKVGTNGC